MRAAGLCWLWLLWDEHTRHWDWPEGREGPALRVELTAGAGCLLVSGLLVLGVVRVLQLIL
ncbi:hypothetical protein ACGFIR_10655 [Micromonospora sp. NPDC049051]|uniref:hypothetical protein n=1 Tax=Micromonospora sp. NPDC049051 TaxID=3364264 RepID=UPI0037230DB5